MARIRTFIAVALDETVRSRLLALNRSWHKMQRM